MADDETQRRLSIRDEADRRNPLDGTAPDEVFRLRAEFIAGARFALKQPLPDVSDEHLDVGARAAYVEATHYEVEVGMPIDPWDRAPAHLRNHYRGILRKALDAIRQAQGGDS